MVVIVVVSALGLLGGAECWAQSRPKQARATIRVKNQCIISGGKLLLHTRIAARYNGIRSASRSDDLWQITCDLGSARCNGARLDLGDVETDRTIGIFDIGPIVGARVSSHSGPVAVIRWGTRSFTIDAKTGTVRYVQASPTETGGGVAKCKGSYSKTSPPG